MIKANTIITCEDSGHYICKVAKDIAKDDEIYPKNFHKYGEAQLPIVNNQPTCMIKCCICGGDWIYFDIDGDVLLHTEEGWK